MRRFLAVLAVSLVVLSGCKGDPGKPEFWQKAIDGAHKTKDKLRVIEDMRSSKGINASFVPMINKELETAKHGEVRGALARVLAELKDPSSVEPLMAALDFAASESEDKSANKEIVLALGSIGDKKATPAMLKALNTKDNYTVIAAIEGLGQLKAADAYDKLNEYATNESGETFITKKAIQALGDVGDKRAVPTLIRMMVKERRGVSFYAESSFALYQIGDAAADALVTAIDGKDKELNDWMAANKILKEAMEAKAAQVLGDLHEARANKKLIEMLAFKHEADDIRLFVRMRAADALGRIRAKEAAKPLAGMVEEIEPNARHEYCAALIRIGGKDALPALEKSIEKGPWDAREQSVRALGQIGDEKSLAALEKLTKGETKLTVDECKADPDQGGCDKPEEFAKKHLAIIETAMMALKADKECGDDVGCWSKKLDDKEAAVRMRAALELGHSGKAAAVDPLLGHLHESDLETRVAIMAALDWLISDSKEAASKAHAKNDDVQKQLSEEKGKTEFVKVNEDLKRLALKIQRAS